MYARVVRLRQQISYDYNNNNNNNNDNIVIMSGGDLQRETDRARTETTDAADCSTRRRARRGATHTDTHAGARAHARCSHTDLYTHTHESTHTPTHAHRSVKCACENRGDTSDGTGFPLSTAGAVAAAPPDHHSSPGRPPPSFSVASSHVTRTPGARGSGGSPRGVPPRRRGWRSPTARA